VFRKINYPDSLAYLPGQIFLHSMPGRDEYWQTFIKACSEHNIGTILCLTSESEIGLKSPVYSCQSNRQALFAQTEMYPIEDFSIPDNLYDFQSVLKRAAQSLAAGQHLLVHCAAGIGRTGCAAICILCEFGVAVEMAIELVKNAGSGPETPGQLAFVKNYRADPELTEMLKENFKH
jgi:protein-tyrosine phosphatase